MGSSGSDNSLVWNCQILMRESAVIREVRQTKINTPELTVQGCGKKGKRRKKKET